MVGERAAGVTGVLARRRDVLASLAARPRTQAEIATALDISRSTVTRAIDELQDHDLVTRVEGEYEPTRLGQTLLESHDRYHELVAALVEAEPLLRHLPPDAPFDPKILVDGTVQVVGPGAGFEIRDLVTDSFRDAEAIRGLGKTRSERDSGRIHYQKVIEEERPVETVMSTDLFDHVRSLDWADEFFAADNLDVYVHETVPYGLFLLELPEQTLMILVVYDDEGSMKGLVRNESPTAVAWAESVYETYREDAVPRTEYDQ